MRVAIAFSLDIDAVAWSTDYGIEGAPAIRADVKAHVQASVEEHLRSLGLLSDGRPGEPLIRALGGAL